VAFLALFLFAVLSRREFSASGAAVAEAVEATAEDDSIPLTSLTDEQVDSALDTMDSATLTQIIKSQGFTVEEGTGHDQILEAAKILVKKERDRQQKEMRGGDGMGAAATSAGEPATSASAGSGSSRDSAQKKTPPVAVEKKTEASEESLEESSDRPKGKGGVEGWTHRDPIPEGATFWDLFGAQVAADLGPFWRIIPEPIRMAVAHHSKFMAKPLRQALFGAVGPLLKVASKMLNFSGRFLIALGGNASDLSLHIATMADNSNNSVGSPRKAIASSDSAFRAREGAFEDYRGGDEEEEAELIEL
jgi:hypothetical protein